MRVAKQSRRTLLKVVASIMLVAASLSGILLLGANPLFGVMVGAQSVDEFVDTTTWQTCHTTEFDPTSGECTFEGVTCVSCYGTRLTMAVNPSSELWGIYYTGEHSKEKFAMFEEGTHSDSGSDIHDRRLIIDLQGVGIAVDKYDPQEVEYNERLSSLGQEEERTTLIIYVAYGGAAIIVILAVVVAIYYYRYEGD